MTQVLLAGAGLSQTRRFASRSSCLHRFVSGGGVLPRRVGLAMEEKRAVAGVFGVEVDLPGQDRGAHDIGRAELHLALDRNAARFQHLRDHVAEQRALGVILRGDDDRPGLQGPSRAARRCQRQGDDRGETKRSHRPTPRISGGARHASEAKIHGDLTCFSEIASRCSDAAAQSGIASSVSIWRLSSTTSLRANSHPPSPRTTRSI